MGQIEFSAPLRKDVLRYYAMRRQNSPHALVTIRRMKLFLRANPAHGRSLRSAGEPSVAARFTSLDMQGVIFYTLYDTKHLKHNHAGNLMELNLPGCCFLTRSQAQTGSTSRSSKRASASRRWTRSRL